jgi:hypothetical protein
MPVNHEAKVTTRGNIKVWFGGGDPSLQHPFTGCPYRGMPADLVRQVVETCG